MAGPSRPASITSQASTGISVEEIRLNASRASTARGSKVTLANAGWSHGREPHRDFAICPSAVLLWPRVPGRLQELIFRMAHENPMWGEGASLLSCSLSWEFACRLVPFDATCRLTLGLGTAFLLSPG